MWKTKVQSRCPNAKETLIIAQLQTDLTTHFNEELHSRLLSRLWNALNPSDIGLLVDPYKRHSKNWVHLGFQREDPAIDIRGGGQLALQSMVYFSELYRDLALQTLADNRYSWGIAGINITVMLMQVLDLCPTQGTKYTESITKTKRQVAASSVRNKISSSRYRRKPYWCLFETKAGFYELFVHCFRTLHEIWVLKDANEMNFNEILYQTGQKIIQEVTQSRIRNGEDYILEKLHMQSSSNRSRVWLNGEISQLKMIPNELYQPWTVYEVELLQKIQRHSMDKVNNMEERRTWTNKSNRSHSDPIDSRGTELIQLNDLQDEEVLACFTPPTSPMQTKCGKSITTKSLNFAGSSPTTPPKPIKIGLIDRAKLSKSRLTKRMSIPPPRKSGVLGLSFRKAKKNLKESVGNENPITEFTL